MSKREQSDSITHLVKIVAEEVFGKCFAKYFDTHFERRMRDVCITKNEPVSVANVINALDNVGGKWQKAEDALLVKEVTVALEAIAKNHGRTASAIKHRINDKGLLYDTRNYFRKF